MLKDILKNTLSKFDLIIDLQTKFRNSLILKNTHNFFTQKHWMVLASKKIKFISNDHLENLGLFLGENIPLFKVKKLPEKSLMKLQTLPNSNYGFITQGNEYRKKVGQFINLLLANKVTTKNKTPVFFIEKYWIDRKN